jgi:hypothetical protein
MLIFSIALMIIYLIIHSAVTGKMEIPVSTMNPIIVIFNEQPVVFIAIQILYTYVSIYFVKLAFALWKEYKEQRPNKPPYH